MPASIANSSLQCRLCRQIGTWVLLSILAIEAAILLPSYLRHESDLLGRLERESCAAVVAAMLEKGTATTSEILATGRALVNRGMLAGGALYDRTGTLVGRFGTAPALGPEALAGRSDDGETGTRKAMRRSDDGRWFDVTWSPKVLGLPYTLIGRIDASAVSGELTAFVWRIVGLVLLISGFVCAATMAVVGRAVLAPLLKLRHNLTAASEDPDHVDRYTMAELPGGELGDVVGATNQLLEHVAASHRDSLHAMTAMAEQAADAILAYDETGEILYANRACVKMCDLPDIGAMKSARLPRFAFGDDGVALALPESLAGGAYSREAALIGRNGKRTAVVVNASRVPRDSRSPVRYFASITDISELRRAQEKLEQQNVELRAASRAKSEFLANMSHELRTPLNAVIGFSEAFMNGLFGPLGDARYREYASDINESGRHLLGIINDILDLSKIEAGKMQLNEAPVTVVTVIDAAVRFVRERAEEGKLRLTVVVGEDLPRLHADERAVKQMLINLLSNAIKFTGPGGEVSVAAWLDGKAIALAVGDTGVGMEPDDIPLALEPFRQVDGSLARQHEGTGLGLPLVKSLIELHGGACRLDSNRGVGTMVVLRFPEERTVGGSECRAAQSVA